MDVFSSKFHEGLERSSYEVKKNENLQCFCAMTLFYCAHWQTYVSGTLRFGKVDVTEAQCTIMAIHMISAIFGPNIWMAKVSLMHVKSLFIRI